jgi:hypothetical protein
MFKVVRAGRTVALSQDMWALAEIYGIANIQFVEEWPLPEEHTQKTFTGPRQCVRANGQKVRTDLLTAGHWLE